MKKCIVSMLGDYAAFHEVYFGIFYVFNNNDYLKDDLAEWVDKEYAETHYKTNDELAIEWFDQFEQGSGNDMDYQMFDCVEVDGKIFVNIT